jgi:hypothetical protein
MKGVSAGSREVQGNGARRGLERIKQGIDFSEEILPFVSSWPR